MKTQITFLIFMLSFMGSIHQTLAKNLNDDYCIPVFSSGCQYNMIDDFTLIGENDTSITDLDTGCSTDSYDDRTDLSVDLIPGGNYIAHVTTNAYGDQVAAWIDFGNGFEKVAVSDGMIDQDNGSDVEIYIPPSAEEGTYRMRVMLGWGGNADNYTPCNDDSNKRNSGEVHDYTVNILSASDCTPPSNFSVSHVHTTEVELEWMSNGEESQWEILYGEPGFDPSNEGETLIVEDTPAGVITDLEPNTTYSAYVRAICDEASELSNAISFTTLCLPIDVPFNEDFENVTPPARPECSVLETISGSDWKTAEVNQNGFDSNALRYTFMMGENANTWYFVRGLNMTANKTYTLTYKYGNDSFDYNEKLKVAYGMAPESEAMVNELADHPNVSGSFPYTNEVSFTPSETGVYYVGFNAYSNSGQSMLFLDDIEIIMEDSEEECLAPEQIEVSNITDTSAEVSWLPAGDVSAWRVTYYEEENEEDAETIEVSGTPSVVLTDLNPETSYAVYVSTICDDDLMDSAVVWFETDEDMAVNDALYENFKFYPNPVVDQLTLSADSPIEQVQIFDLQGKLVQETQSEFNELNISAESLSPGIYFMKVKMKGSSKTFKLIKK